jgi:hypothetical protein
LSWAILTTVPFHYLERKQATWLVAISVNSPHLMCGKWVTH